MSTHNSHPFAYPYSWLQPIRYDQDQFRDFAQALDADLADFVANRATRRPLYTYRQYALAHDQRSMGDSNPQVPPGAASNG